MRNKIYTGSHSQAGYLRPWPAALILLGLFIALLASGPSVTHEQTEQPGAWG